MGAAQRRGLRDRYERDGGWRGDTWSWARETETGRNEKTTKSRTETSEGCKREGEGGGGLEGHMEWEAWQRARGIKAILSLSPSPPHTLSLFSRHPWIYIWLSTLRSLAEQGATPSLGTPPLRNHGDETPGSRGGVGFTLFKRKKKKTSRHLLQI